MANQQFIGRYQIHELIGQGSMGSVFKAHDPTLTRWVAIKTVNTHLRKSIHDTDEFKERFLREAQTSSQLNHPNIIGVFDMGICQEEPFLVMEYMDGLSLEEILLNRDQFTRSYQFSLLTQFATGLDYAHKQGYIHRDIKPANFLVARSGQAKIVDFGLARLQDSNITTSSMFLGTPSYASPEQIQPGEILASSDIFSFGIVAFEVLFGKRPFPGDNISSTLYQIVHASPDFDFGRLEPWVDSNSLERAFGKVLAKSPQYRPSNCLTLVKELANIFQVHPNNELDWTGVFQDISAVASPKHNTPQSNGGIHYDETIAMNDNPRSWTGEPLSVFSGRWQIILGAVLVIFAGWIYYSAMTSKPEPGVIEPANQDATFDRLPFIATTDQPPLKPDLKEKNLSDQLHQIYRMFWSEVVAENWDGARQSLEAYSKAGADVVEVERMKAILSQIQEKDPKPATTADSDRYKQELVQEFQKAKNEDELDGMRTILSQYRKKWPDDKATRLALENDLQQTQAIHSQQIQAARQGLQTAIANWDPITAGTMVTRLAALSAFKEPDRIAFATLKRMVFTDEFGIKFIRIRKGSFIMGLRISTSQVADATSQLQKVNIPHDLFMSATEVTQAQYSQVMGQHASRFIGENLPVSNISWKDAQRFIETLNEKAGEQVYRLPSMAEWEYACRAGGSQLYHFGGEITTDLANSGLNQLNRPVPTASFPPNRWGLHDMHGNLWEWCDAANGVETYPDSEPPNDSPGLLAKNRPSIRGGAFDSIPLHCAAGFTQKRWSFLSHKNVGLRLIRISRPQNVASAH